jgi:hypothetical protein
VRRGVGARQGEPAAQAGDDRAVVAVGQPPERRALAGLLPGDDLDPLRLVEQPERLAPVVRDGVGEEGDGARVSHRSRRSPEQPDRT